MSDAAPAKKKKGKLPIVLALVAVLGGGGFFMMKKGKPADAAHTVAIAEEEVEIEPEFLVNMSDGRTYLKTKIAVKLRKDFKAEEFGKHKVEVADAVNICLKGTDPKDTVAETDMKRLKRKIAAAINKALGGAPGAAGGAGHGKTTEVDLSKEKKGAHEGPGDIPEDWDSLEGPVLKVLFASFATQ